MNSRTISIIVVTLLIYAHNALGEGAGVIRISTLGGDTQVLNQDTGQWEQASLNMPVGAGDSIRIDGEGRVELQAPGGINVRLGDNTLFDVIELSENDAHFYLERGHVYINNKRGGIKTVQTDTPLASCNSSDNSITLIDASDDTGETSLSVVKGFAYLESRNGKTRVASGKTLHLDDSGAELAPIAPPDDWERWNYRRDQRAMTLGESARYLPEELHDYAHDFDDNGKWAYVGGYGYVWSPTVVDTEWVPFRLGRWIWARGDYVWVSDEGWGWAPYHYGRWAFVRGSGWCWIPPAAGAAYWGPGFVAWIHTPTTVAWVPLAPGETYYGRRTYGPGTVTIPATVPNQPFVKTVYRNAAEVNGVTVIKSETFVRREKPKSFIRANPFTQPAAPQPALPPPIIRETHQPRQPLASGSQQSSTPPRHSLPATLPPQSVISPTPAPRPSVVYTPLRADRGKQRVLVRDNNQSAFTPGKPPTLSVIRRDTPKTVSRRAPAKSPEQKGGKGVPMAAPSR